MPTPPDARLSSAFAAFNDVGLEDPLDAYADLLGDTWGKGTTAVHPPDAGAYAEYLGRPVDFGRDVLGRQYIPAQAAAVRALHKHRRVQLIGSRKTGKTFAAVGVICEFMSTAPTVVITTAPTGRQVRERLWAEIRKAVMTSKQKLPGHCGVVSWRVAPGWDAIGFATDDPENVLGFHADAEPPWATVKGARLLFVLDDAPGIDQAIFDAMQGSFASGDVYILVLGNPLLEQDDPHFFAQINKNGSGFHRIHTSACEASRFGQEHDVLADECFHEPPPWLVSDGWIVEREREWGADSPLFRAHVLGIYSRPGSSSLQVISHAMLDAAEVLNAQSEQGRHIGVDIARMGGDEISAALAVNGVMAARHAWRKTDLMTTADTIIALSKTWGVDGTPIPAGNVHIDATGMGSGPFDRLAQRGFMVDGVDFGAAPCGDFPDLFGELRPKNRRAEMHWVVRRQLEEGGGHIPAQFEAARRQATWARYKVLTEGSTGSVLRIEPKEDIRARHGRSPDDWEAYMLTWSRGGVIRPTFGRR